MCYQNISQTELLIKGHKDPAINLLGHHKIKSKGGIYYPKLTSLCPDSNQTDNNSECKNSSK